MYGESMDVSSSEYGFRTNNTVFYRDSQLGSEKRVEKEPILGTLENHFWRKKCRFSRFCLFNTVVWSTQLWLTFLAMACLDYNN